MGATYFGEVNELDSRAVWYSDEEEEENDYGMVSCGAGGYIETKPPTHEVFRSIVNITFQSLTLKSTNVTFTQCIICLASSPSFKNYKSPTMSHIANFGSIGKAFTNSEKVLWILVDSGSPQIAGQEVGYVTEKLRESVLGDLNLSSECEIVILSKQYSASRNMEYLSNSKRKQFAEPIRAPFLIKNQFESALFEQLTLLNRSASIVCLPNPRDYTFEGAQDIPREVTDFRLKEDSLNKTLIFT